MSMRGRSTWTPLQRTQFDVHPSPSKLARIEIRFAAHFSEPKAL